MKSKKQKVAIFDVDGTIFRSSLFLQLIFALIDKGIFPKSTRDEYAQMEKRWLDRTGDYDSFLMAAVKSFMIHIKGVHYSDFADVAAEIVVEQQSRVYKYTRDLVAKLHTKKYYLVAISQSPKTVLEEFCKKLHFDKVYGRIYQIGATNKFTGEVNDLHLIANKANIVKRVIEKEGLTLDGSVGVGDTEGDIPMLELVERPIAFNPNEKLYRHARRMGWEVVVERKDVIYKL